MSEREEQWRWNKEFKRTIRLWWQQFDPARREPGNSQKGASLRGDLAELRRCGATSEVIFCAGFHRLWVALRAKELVKGTTENYQGDERWLAVVVGVLAHVEADSAPDDDAKAPSFAQEMASVPPKKAEPAVSDLRFRKLLRATNPEDLFKQLSSVVRLMRGRANVADLAWSIRGLCLPWHEETRRQWAFAYYAAPNPTAKK